MDEELVAALNESCLDFSNISPWCSKQHSNTPHKCSICNSGLDLLKHLLTHSGVVTEDSLYVCKICLKSFRLKTTLARHILRHKEEGVVRLSSSNTDLDESIHNSSTEMKRLSSGNFMCLICLKKFSHQKTLIRHQKIHSGTLEQHACDLCEKVFSYKQSLKRHKFQLHSKGDQTPNDDVVLITSACECV